MVKAFFGACCICSLLILFVSSIQNDDNYDEIYEDGTEYGNNTEENDFHGRDEQLISELRPFYPVNHYLDSRPQNSLQELFDYKRPLKRPGLKKRRRLKKKGHKYIVPLLLNVLTKMANFLPVAKLTLLALFSLMLFSKKALLVSIGSLILVIYDNFYKKYKVPNIVKNRTTTVPTVDQGSLVESNFEEWWGRGEIKPPILDYPHESSKKNKERKWWAPQVNLKAIKDLKPWSDSKMTEDEI